ncbi:hypothetical protein KBB49_01085 [Candidatus Saccharibacteria bacterium]|nr:hypothetical protein [Candidatus Saccharibacteria bacterium]
MTNPNLDPVVFDEMPKQPIDAVFEVQGDVSQAAEVASNSPFVLGVADELFTEIDLGKTTISSETLEIAEQVKASRLKRFGKAIIKPARVVLGTTGLFLKDTYEQTRDADTLRQKILVGSIALSTAGGQVADRFHLLLPTVISASVSNIENPPFDIPVKYGNYAGSATLGIGVYLSQFAVGSAWGLGVKKFNKPREFFESEVPQIKKLAEENAGYKKTLWRHSVTGLYTGNTMFVGAEVINKPDQSTWSVFKAANKTALRLGVSAGILGLGLAELLEKYPDKSVGIGRFDLTVPELVENMKGIKFFLIFGVGVEVLAALIGAGIKGTKSGIKSLNNVLHKNKLATVGE